jgi:transitional endoplasmic reticulum ATPase
VVRRAVARPRWPESLQRPLIVKRASDLLSPWVGETEQLLARAFEEAERDQAVLLLDEADSFLSARHEGQARWERSQVNELLKQVEDYPGWFCAASNLPDTLDPAVLRRFDFKFRFGWLELPARLAMLEDYLLRHRVVRELDTPLLTRALAELPYLLPGDLAAIRRRIEIAGAPPSDREVLAWLASDHALKPEARVRQIGFARVA